MTDLETINARLGTKASNLSEDSLLAILTAIVKALPEKETDPEAETDKSPEPTEV